MADPFTSDERQVIGALILPRDAPITEQIVEAVAKRTGLSEHQVAATLRKLDDMDPPDIHRDVDAKLCVEFWVVVDADAGETPDSLD